MGLVKWYTWPLKFLLRTGRYATALNDVERGRISSSLLFIPMLQPWPFSRHAGRSRKIREFSFIISLTLDMRTHTNMDRFNPFLHTEVDQFNPLALTNLYYLHLMSNNFACCHTGTQQQYHNFCLNVSRDTDTDQASRERRAWAGTPEGPLV